MCAQRCRAMVRGGGRSGPYGRQNASGDQVHVTGLPPNLDENQLRQFFAAYGTVEKCKLLPSKTQGTTTALVRFKHTVEAESMKEKLHGTKPPGSPAEVRVSFSTGNEGETVSARRLAPLAARATAKQGARARALARATRTMRISTAARVAQRTRRATTPSASKC